jgi:hypothetical protein
MKKILLLILFAAEIGFAQSVFVVSAEGNKLREFYLNQHVEKLWLAGQHINWESGKPDDPTATKGIKTHCSAFVASVCKQQDIFIPHPPNKGSLANAQYDWLFSAEGYTKGWRQIKEKIFETAQQYANKGMIVVAVYKNTNAAKPGHIALVMPDETTEETLNKKGTTMIQAGRINGNSIFFRQGFERHITSWDAALTEVAFFYNEGGKFFISK